MLLNVSELANIAGRFQNAMIKRMYDDIDDIDDSMVELNDEASYVCGSCGEDIVVPVDSSEGRQQQYVEDCPVCCCPNVIYVEIDEEGFPNVRSHLE